MKSPGVDAVAVFETVRAGDVYGLVYLKSGDSGSMVSFHIM